MEKYELWFRLVYEDLILSKTMTAAVRPGDRREPNPKGTKVGEEVLIRILKKSGIPELECTQCLQKPKFRP
jgi:hypothetical protein